MSEKIIHPESRHHPEIKDSENESHHHKHESELSKAKKELSEINMHKLRHEAKTHAESVNTFSEKEKTPTKSYGNQKELKESAYAQSLINIQQNLNKPAKVFSKIIHNNVVEKVSDVSAKTIARPSGLLVGSIFAFIGSTLLLYSAKHYGYRYNFLVFFLLFIAGFVLGILLEFLGRLLKIRKIN